MRIYTCTEGELIIIFFVSGDDTSDTAVHRYTFTRTRYTEFLSLVVLCILVVYTRRVVFFKGCWALGVSFFQLHKAPSGFTLRHPSPPRLHAFKGESSSRTNYKVRFKSCTSTFGSRKLFRACLSARAHSILS